MPEQPPTLRDMIKAVKDSGLTYEQIAAKAIDPQTGKRTAGSFLNSIVLGNVNRLPEPHNLRAIAAGLGVPYERVRVAAIAQWLPPEDGAAGTVDDIPPERRAQLMEDVEQLRTLAARVQAELEGEAPATSA
jgi:hypothetical protein